MEESDLFRNKIYSLYGTQVRLTDWAVSISRQSAGKVLFVQFDTLNNKPLQWHQWENVKDALQPYSDVVLEKHLSDLQAEIDELRLQLKPKDLAAPKLSFSKTILVIDGGKEAEYYEIYLVITNEKEIYLKGPVDTTKSTQWDASDYVKEFDTFAVVSFGGELRSSPATITYSTGEPGPDININPKE